MEDFLEKKSTNELPDFRVLLKAPLWLFFVFLLEFSNWVRSRWDSQRFQVSGIRTQRVKKLSMHCVFRVVPVPIFACFFPLNVFTILFIRKGKKMGYWKSKKFWWLSGQPACTAQKIHKRKSFRRTFRGWLKKKKKKRYVCFKRSGLTTKDAAPSSHQTWGNLKRK